MLQNKRSIWTFLLSGLMILLAAGTAFAGEADIKVLSKNVQILLLFCNIIHPPF